MNHDNKNERTLFSTVRTAAMDADLPWKGILRAACAAVLATVGMLVLRQTCKPFGLFRHILWWVMAGALVFCFTVLSGFFDLTYGGWTEILAVLGAMALAATLYFGVFKGIQWLSKRS